MNLRGKRVLVTGARGFLGKHILQVLWERGVYDATPTNRDYDLREKSAVDSLFERAQPDIVIHAAATVGGIAANQSEPGRFFYDNMMMGMLMLDGARVFGVEKFVQIGTACEYPKNSLLPLQEWDIWNGKPEPTNSSYGIAKRALLEMGQAYRQQYNMSVIHLLPTNLYGPGDNADPQVGHVVMAMVNKFLKAKQEGIKEVTLWGTGFATRDFLYVKDAAEGIVKATEEYDASAPVNLGSGRETSILELAWEVATLTRYTGSIVWDGSKPSGQPRRVLDTYVAKRFGWQAATSLGKGLMETIEWYEKLLSGR